MHKNNLGWLYMDANGQAERLLLRVPIAGWGKMTRRSAEVGQNDAHRAVGSRGGGLCLVIPDSAANMIGNHM